MKLKSKIMYIVLSFIIITSANISHSNPFRDEDGDWIQRPLWKVMLLQEPNDDDFGKHYYRKANRYEAKDIQKALQFYQYGSIYKNRLSLTRLQELTKKVN